MNKFILRRSKKSQSPPGSLVYIGRKNTPTKINYILFSEKKYMERVVTGPEECLSKVGPGAVAWIDVSGLSDVHVIEKICNHFGIHPLVQEDIVNTEQRPKAEDHGEYIYIVLKMLYLSENHSEIEQEQISIIITKNFVLSFREEDTRDVFSVIKERMRESLKINHKIGTDYLAYSLTDSIVDNYFNILEYLGEYLERLEEEVISSPTNKTARQIQSMKNELIYLRKAVWPLRELVTALENSQNPLLTKPTRLYLRDVYDHTIQAIDNIETLRDLASGILEMYLSSISNRMNEIMKILTIYSTIFIPLTFIVGIYGMNFRYMPELEWKYGYLFVWFVMGVLTLFMLLYFRKKKWL